VYHILPTYPVNRVAFVSPGSFVYHQGKLYLNRNARVSRDYDPDHRFTVKVLAKYSGVFVFHDKTCWEILA
jgi:hypothetical protein